MKNLFILLILINFLFASEDFTKIELPFLLLQGNARPISMAEAYLAVANDADTMYFNSAGLGILKNNEINFMANKWYANINLIQITYVHSLSKGNGGIGVFFIDTGQIEKKDELNKIEGNIDINQGITNFAYGQKINEWGYVGGNIKIPFEKIEKKGKSKVVFDCGMLVTFFDKDLKIGLVLENLGTNLPTNIKTGFSYKIKPEILSSHLLVANDIIFALDDTTSFNFGLEHNINEQFFLRIGYNLKNISCGFGFQWENYKVDYALTPHQNLNWTHCFSFGILFGGEIKKQKTKKLEEELRTKVEKELEEKIKLMTELFYKQGVDYFDKNLYEESIDAFDKTLIWDPNYILAEEKMQEVKRKLERKKIENEIKEYIKEGEIKFKEKKIIEALSCWKLALNLDETNLEVLKLIDKAEQEFKKKTVTNEIKKYFEEGIAYYTQGKYNKAIDEWNKLLKLNPTHQETKEYILQAKEKIKLIIEKSLELGKKYKEEGKLIEARKEIMKVIDMDNNNSDAKEYLKIIQSEIKKITDEYFDKGVKYFNDKKYYQAEYEFEMVLKYFPNNSKSQGYLDKIKEKIKKILLEEVDVAKAKKIYYEGVSYYMNGELEKAVQCWQEALNINPYDENIKKTLERAVLKLKYTQ